MASRFATPDYNVTLASGERVTIDVTNSISAGLPPNNGLVNHLSEWMEERGYTSILDFGAGALRHTLPLLDKGFQVIAVEYERAFQRPKAKDALEIARRYDGFTALVWPDDFLRLKRFKYDVALLMYVLQVIPIQRERDIVLDAIGTRFHRYGPRRLYYASRFGEAQNLLNSTKYNDGWVQGKGVHDRSFYTEWNADVTNKLFAKQGYERAGRYGGATQGYIYDYHPGVL